MTKPKKKRGPYMPEELKKFGEAVRLTRTARGFSQTGFAFLIGISNKTLDNIEAARNWPSMPVYITICKVLDARKPTFLE